MVLALIGIATFAAVRLRPARRVETPPPAPNRLHLVRVQPVVGDPQAFRIVARMSRPDEGPILGAFEMQVDLRDPSTGKPLLQRQCASTLQDAPDGRSMEITLVDRLPAWPARPVQAQVWVQNRWVPDAERRQWELWQLAGAILPHPLPQSEPQEPLTCRVTLPAAAKSGRAKRAKTQPEPPPQAVRTLLWRTPDAPRLALRR